MVHRRGKRGFTLLEVLIDAFLITAIFGAIIGTYIYSLRSVNSGKERLVASQLASEKLEKLKTVPYEQLATQNGSILPQGAIVDSETITRGGATLTVQTVIITVDDPADGCAIPSGSMYQCTDGSSSSLQDLVPTDFKRVTVKVWQASTLRAELSTNVTGSAAETAGNTGMLLAIITNAEGLPVENSIVTITNPQTGVNLQAFSNILGQVFVANVPPDSQNGYKISATKAGYSTDYTVDRTPQNPNQPKADVDVYAQQVTTQTLSIDLVSTINIAIKDTQQLPLPNLTISTVGQKIIYNNPTTPKNTYTQTSDSLGNITVANAEWDSYSIVPPNGYYLVSVSPYQPFSVSPNSNTAVVITLSTDSNYPRLTDVAPTSASTNTSVLIDFDGENFATNSTVVLRKSGQNDILGVVDAAANGKSMSVSFNLTNAATGDWDIVVTSNGQNITQLSGLVISP